MPKVAKTFPYICKATVRGKRMWRVHTGRRFAKREDHYFATRPEAEEKADEMRKRLDAEGKDGLVLPTAHRADA